ncbi:hypothetical protein CBS101457_006618 [Exobasidium rhododendri]|nr:hypothetical protein CBS101457_006618 [Exobasidium rhododendri]
MHTVPIDIAARTARADKDDDDEEDLVERRAEPQLDARLTVTLGRKSSAREVVLMATVVLLAKMRFGLDGEERFENYDEEEIWSGSPTLAHWLSSLKKQEQQVNHDHRSTYDPQSLQREASDKEEDDSVEAIDMDDDQLDTYLDYAERTLILSQRPTAYQWRRREGIDDLLSCAPELNAGLPLVREDLAGGGERVGGETLGQKKDFVEGSLKDLYEDAASKAPRPSLLSISQLRPGDAHSLYTNKDPSQTHPPDYQQVLHHASQVVGCRQGEMADTVYAVEVGLIKMLLWRRKKREASDKQTVREQQGKRRPGRPRKVPVEQ